MRAAGSMCTFLSTVGKCFFSFLFFCFLYLWFVIELLIVFALLTITRLLRLQIQTLLSALGISVIDVCCFQRTSLGTDWSGGFLLCLPSSQIL